MFLEPKKDEDVSSKDDEKKDELKKDEPKKDVKKESLVHGAFGKTKSPHTPISEKGKSNSGVYSNGNGTPIKNRRASIASSGETSLLSPHSGRKKLKDVDDRAERKVDFVLSMTKLLLEQIDFKDEDIKAVEKLCLVFTPLQAIQNQIATTYRPGKSKGLWACQFMS
jgi:hypothetical protein